jgi:hypothetical protein
LRIHKDLPQTSCSNKKKTQRRIFTLRVLTSLEIGSKPKISVTMEVKVSCILDDESPTSERNTVNRI